MAFVKHVIAVPDGEPETLRKVTLQKQRDFACIAIYFLPWAFVLSDLPLLHDHRGCQGPVMAALNIGLEIPCPYETRRQ